MDYDKVKEFKQTEKVHYIFLPTALCRLILSQGQTLKDYKKSHKSGESTWDHEHAARVFSSQYLHDIKTDEEKQKKSPQILLQIIQDLEKLGLLDKLNAEVKVRVKTEGNNNFKTSNLSSSDEKSLQEWVDLNELREELLKQQKQQQEQQQKK